MDSINNKQFKTTAGNSSYLHFLDSTLIEFSKIIESIKTVEHNQPNSFRLKGKAKLIDTVV